MASFARAAGQKPGGNGAFSHFSDSLPISPEALALAMISLILAKSFGSSLLSPAKQGLSLITNCSVGARAGTFSAMAAATVLPVAMRSTWPETKAAMVALLSSKRLMVASDGAVFDSSCSSMAPMVLPLIGGSGELHVLGAEHPGEERRIGVGEVDHLLALGILAEAGDDDVGLVGLQIGNPIGAGDRDDLGLQPERGGDQVAHVDVVALRLEIEPGGAERREILRYRDLDDLRRHHGIERVGIKSYATLPPRHGRRPERSG
jgi:hypothetical protein